MHNLSTYVVIAIIGSTLFVGVPVFTLALCANNTLMPIAAFLASWMSAIMIAGVVLLCWGMSGVSAYRR